MTVHYTPVEYYGPYQRLFKMTDQYGREGLNERASGWVSERASERASE